jgi:hypothetical protein
MRSTTHKLQTNTIPPELTPLEINEAARGVTLFYVDNQFKSQSFFTPPLIGEINRLEGLDTEADVHFREIHQIGTNLFHVRVVAKENMLEKMFADPNLYSLLRGISSTLDENVRSRWYLETTTGREAWDVLVSLDKKSFYLVNNVKLRNKKVHIGNIIVVGDWLLGRTEEGEAVSCQLTPDVLEKENITLVVEPMESVNRLGRVDLLEAIPNSENSFLVCLSNVIYEFSIWGDMIQFNTLEEKVSKIKSIGFNSTSAILATNQGLFEVDVREMPNMVRAASLPRQVVHPDLRGSFKMAQYVEDPFVLGIHPAMGIFAKTTDDKVLCF